MVYPVIVQLAFATMQPFQPLTRRCLSINRICFGFTSGNTRGTSSAVLKVEAFVHTATPLWKSGSTSSRCRCWQG